MDVTASLEVAMGHRLLDYVGKCASPHGHNYRISVTLTGKLDNRGMVVDFKDVRSALKEVLEPFDHSMVLRWDDPLVSSLREDPTARLVLLSANPTAENLARLLFSLVADTYPLSVAAVHVQETEGGAAGCDENHGDIEITEYVLPDTQCARGRVVAP